MAYRPSLPELGLGCIVLALGGFVATQAATTSPLRRTASPLTLSPVESTRITQAYHARMGMLESSYRPPAWLAEVHVRLMHAAALRERAEGAPALPPPDSVRAVLADAERGSYVDAMLEQDHGAVMRWRPREAPVRVWVQGASTESGFSPALVGPARMAFLVWNELALGVQFAFVDDSTQAEVHVTWSERMPKTWQIGTTVRTADADGWLVFAHVVLSTSFDIHAVQNAARHEVGHVLGLGHSPNEADIMAAATEGKMYRLTEADRRSAALWYRLPAGPLPTSTTP